MARRWADFKLPSSGLRKVKIMMRDSQASDLMQKSLEEKKNATTVTDPVTMPESVVQDAGRDQETGRDPLEEGITETGLTRAIVAEEMIVGATHQLGIEEEVLTVIEMVLHQDVTIETIEDRLLAGGLQIKTGVS